MKSHENPCENLFQNPQNSLSKLNLQSESCGPSWEIKPIKAPAGKSQRSVGSYFT